MRPRRAVAFTLLASLVAALLLVPPALGWESADGRGPDVAEESSEPGGPAPAAGSHEPADDHDVDEDGDIGLMDFSQAPAEAAAAEQPAEEPPAPVADHRSDKDDGVGLMENLPGPDDPEPTGNPGPGQPVAGGATPAEPASDGPQSDAQRLRELAKRLEELKGSDDPAAANGLRALLDEVDGLRETLVERSYELQDVSHEPVDLLHQLGQLGQQAAAALDARSPTRAADALRGRLGEMTSGHGIPPTTDDWRRLLDDIDRLRGSLAGGAGDQDLAGRLGRYEQRALEALERAQAELDRRARQQGQGAGLITLGAGQDATAGLLSGDTRARQLAQALLDWTPKPSAPAAQGPVTTPPQSVGGPGWGQTTETFPLEPPPPEVVAVGIGLGIATVILTKLAFGGACLLAGPPPADLAVAAVCVAIAP